jgi:hypothetical protein
MTKDEALKLALEALELHGKQYPHMVKGYCLDAITTIKAALEAKDEPVAIYRAGQTKGEVYHVQFLKEMAADEVLLYAAPVQRTWITLTDEEFLKACQLAEDGNYLVAFQRIQQWLKEKNK